MAGSTARSAVTVIGKRNFGIYSEAHVAQVNLDTTKAGHELFFNAERKAVHIIRIVVVVWLIQSQ